MAPRVTEEYLEDRRNHILDSAVASFSRRGLHQTTIEDIRTEAGLSRGAVYHYFKSKEDIIDAIRARSSDQTEAIMDEIALRDGPLAKVLALIETSLAIIASPQSIDANRLALFLWAESIVNGRIMDGQIRSFEPFLDMFVDELRNAQQDGKLNRSLSPEGVARVIIGALLGLQIQLTWDPEIEFDELKYALLALVTGCLSVD